MSRDSDEPLDAWLFRKPLARLTSSVELEDPRVAWRMSPETAEEITQERDVLNTNDRPGHFYVDIATPVETLVLSRDEYTATHFSNQSVGMKAYPPISTTHG